VVVAVSAGPSELIRNQQVTRSSRVAGSIESRSIPET
jgi:hypothetical protein